MASDYCREVVVIGMVGTGKSSLGNSLLGRNEFKVKNFETTEDVEKKSNNEIVVTNTPALNNTATFFSSTALKLLSDRNGCQYPHAFLIVIDAERKGENDFSLIKRYLTIIFGKTCFDHAIVVFTKVNDDEPDSNFKKFWKENEEMRQFVESCGERVARIDNQGDDRHNKVKEIICQVDILSKNGKIRFDLPSKSFRENIFKMFQERYKRIRPSSQRDKHKLFEEEMKEIEYALKQKVWFPTIVKSCIKYGIVLCLGFAGGCYVSNKRLASISQ